jgi:uncharacterized protein (TIGR02588 family)
MAARGKKPDQKQRRGGSQTATENSRAGFRGSDQEAQAIPTLEWIVGGIGFVIIAGVLGFLLYDGMSDHNPLPDIKLSVDAVMPARNGYLVRITATNEGGLTAEGVIVEGELRSGTEMLERSQTVIEFLPSHSKKRAGLYFSRDPRQFELNLRPHGYEEP